jgi:hypothetical protein
MAKLKGELLWVQQLGLQFSEILGLRGAVAFGLFSKHLFGRSKGIKFKS